MNETLRQRLIFQLRYALGELEKPIDDDHTIVFDIVETEYEFDGEILNLPYLTRD